MVWCGGREIAPCPHSMTVEQGQGTISQPLLGNRRAGAGSSLLLGQGERVLTWAPMAEPAPTAGSSWGQGAISLPATYTCLTVKWLLSS
uniref:Uncharacterized protein n=1 Tax=Crocodylus porosus TaxID=8502 RepID=A0A7M4ENX5_CROPO